MKVLVACEYSGIVRDAFAALGHDSWSADILPTDKPGKHYQGNVKEILYAENWDLIIAHPPCTYITNSGVCHLHTDYKRWHKLRRGTDFFKLFLNHPAKMVCIENPIPHKYGRKLIGKKYSQIIQPWMFGHTEQKATCLWLKGLPNLRPTNNVKAEMMLLPDRERQRLHYLSPGPDRWKERSKTYKGIANAMADQWGKPFYQQLNLF